MEVKLKRRDTCLYCHQPIDLANAYDRLAKELELMQAKCVNVIVERDQAIELVRELQTNLSMTYGYAMGLAARLDELERAEGYLKSNNKLLSKADIFLKGGK